MDAIIKENQVPENIRVKKFASFEEEAKHLRENIRDMVSTLISKEEEINDLMLKLDLVRKEKNNSIEMLEDQIIIKNKKIFEQDNEIRDLMRNVTNSI